MASADVLPTYDLHRLSSYLAVPEESLTSLASTQEEYVSIILHSIAAKAKEYDELRADRMRSEVQLEQTVRTAENQVKGMRTQLETAVRENQGLNEKLAVER